MPRLQDGGRASRMAGNTATGEVAASLSLSTGLAFGVAVTSTFSAHVATLAMLALHVATVRDCLDGFAGRRLVFKNPTQADHDGSIPEGRTGFR